MLDRKEGLCQKLAVLTTIQKTDKIRFLIPKKNQKILKEET